MGFITTATTTTLTARLTPLGRQRLVSTNNSLISSFSLGDSDANYRAALTLSTGQIPAESGNIGPNATTSNSTAQNAALKSVLVVNAAGSIKKSVESQSTIISLEQSANGYTSVSSSYLKYYNVDRTNYNTDEKVNWFYSFGLPLNSSNDTTYTGTTYANGGFSDTALSAIAQTNILVIGIDNSKYGDCIDGKTIHLYLPTIMTNYDIYSTFQNKGTTTAVEDANVRETSSVTSGIGSNIAFLFSDQISKPNGGSASLSWATGYNTVKPFSQNNKQLYNLQTNSNLGLSADTIVGIAYLDMGIIVITNPTIVSDYLSDISYSASSYVTLNSVSTSVFQNVTCIAGRGEFGLSTNTTFTSTDTPRISELGLYDNLGNLIAVAKTDRHVTKNVNEFMAFNVKISL